MNVLYNADSTYLAKRLVLLHFLLECGELKFLPKPRLIKVVSGKRHLKLTWLQKVVVLNHRNFKASDDVNVIYSTFKQCLGFFYFRVGFVIQKTETCFLLMLSLFCETLKLSMDLWLWPHLKQRNPHITLWRVTRQRVHNSKRTESDRKLKNKLGLKRYLCCYTFEMDHMIIIWKGDIGSMTHKYYRGKWNKPADRKIFGTFRDVLGIAKDEFVINLATLFFILEQGKLTCM